MATEIQLKRSYTSGQIPGAANVLVGEPVLNLVDRVLYTKDNSGNIIVISSGNASTIASLAFNAANVAAAYTVAGVTGNVSNIQLASGITSSGLLTTANISELTNLYFTNARARESITIASGNVNGKGSYDSATGVISINAANVTVSSSAPTNPYVGDLWIHADTAVEYLFFGDGDTFQWVELGEPSTGTSESISTVAGVTGDVSNVQLASGITQTGILTTSNVTEVTNLYFTNARVYSNVTQLGYITSASLSGYATNSQLTLYATNANVVLKANVADLRTANVAELTNLYFTNARAVSAITNTSLSNITVSGNIILNGYSVGYLEAPQNAQNTSYTLTLTDSGKHIYSQNTATQVLTIPTNANVAFNVGTMVSIVLQGSGSMTVSPFSGVTLYLAGNSTSASRTISTYGMATLMKVATNTWFINGTGVS